MADNKTKRDRNDDEPVREGDILGLGGIVPPKSSNEPSTSFETDVTRNSESIRDEDQDMRRGDTAYKRSSGATGIDMGAGGSGTDVE
jgi:hypothetical protein